MIEAMSDVKASILIVDDRPEKVLALGAVLEDLGQTIVRAYSGRDALRHVLNQDFAVILLDVNMPAMDGFETAKMIRQRNNSRHTPIIFVTAFDDEMHASQGYSLGAVDYILAPVLPEVLRTKVAVFVDLYNKNEQLKRQAESLHRRASQMQKLAAASLAINSALSTDRMLGTITETARDIIGAHQAITLCVVDSPAENKSAPKVMAVGSFSDRYREWRERPLKVNGLASAFMASSKSPTRLTEAEFRDHPDWEIVHDAGVPPIRGGVLAVPLTGRNGAKLGLVYLSDRESGDFVHDDETALVQLAQMGSIAIENTIYAQERQANRVKDEFLATLSHELRTPLNAILGWTQLLKMEKLEGEVSHAVEVIDRSARAQTKLIEDLLDVSRITSSKLTLNLSQGSFNAVVLSAVDAARPAADARQIRIDVQLGADEALVMIDADRMQQVVWNLLSNAIKFTPPQGRIFVELSFSDNPVHPEAAPTDHSNGTAENAGARRSAGWLTLRVTDTGQGIDPGFLPFVFDRFRQADSTSTRRQSGLGIGLAIVRHIVEQHGGVVRAHSEGAGRGTTLTVGLPVAAPKEIEPPPTNGEAPGAIGDGCLRGARVLAVDDDEDSREMLGTMLGRAGATVRLASSAADALDILDHQTFDLLLSDIAMPDEDGFQLMRRIRQRSAANGGAIAAIALTAYAREEDRALAIEAGFDAHLAKPISPSLVLARALELISPRDGRMPALIHQSGAQPQPAVG